MELVGFIVAMALLVLFVVVPLTRLVLRDHPSAAESPRFWPFFRRAYLPMAALGALYGGSRALGDHAADPRWPALAVRAAVGSAAAVVVWAAAAWPLGRRGRRRPAAP